MNKKILSMFLIISMTFTCLLGNIQVFASSASLTISAPGNVSVGDTVSIDVIYSGAEVYGGEFTLLYDSTLLEAVGYTAMTGLSGGGNASKSDGVSYYNFGSGTPISVNGVIITFTYTAIAGGTADFSIGDCEFTEDFDDNLNNITVTMTTGTASTVISNSSESTTTTTTETTTETTTKAAAESTTEATTEADSDFEFDALTGTITGYKGSAETLVIPSTINGVAVKSIGDSAFYDNDDITSVTIPSSVEIIGNDVFWGCDSLAAIYVDSENGYFTSIDGVLFSKDKTGLVVYPRGKSGTSYTVPDGVNTIGFDGFSGNNNLTTVVLPDGLTTLEEGAFYMCFSLKSVNLPDSLTSLGRYAFANTKIAFLEIPSGVKIIRDGTFSLSGLTSLTLPESITAIENYAFYCCSDLTVTISNKSAYISSGAFEDCENLTVYCYKDSTADDTSLYPSNTSIIYLDSIEVAAPAFKVVGVFGGRSVTFTSETNGAVIYYSSSTSNITTDDIMVENGGTVTYEDYYGTIYARAYYNGVWSDVNKFVLKIPVVNTPTVTASGSTVTIKSTTPSSFILYTTDGTEPVVTTDGTATNGTWLRVNGARTNSGTITATPGDTVRAVAVRNCFTTSASAAVYVNVSPAAFKVVGTFGGRNVTFTSNTSGAKIYYSSTTSSLTTSDKCVSNGETVLFEDFYGTIYARAYYNGKWSNVSRLILKIPTINDPTITYSGGKATIRTTTPNCYIYYTTDGTTPSVTNGKKLCSNSYGQVTVSSGTTIKAIAVRSCFTNSTVVSYKVS